MSAPSLPYQTPPWDMSAPSLPYQTPPWDMSAPSLPYQTPPRPDAYAIADAQYASLFDSPQRASTPAPPPPYDPFKTAEAQYASLFDTPRRAPTPRWKARSPTRAVETDESYADESMAESIDDFSLMERLVEEGTPDRSALAGGLSPGRRSPGKSPQQQVEDFLAKGIKTTADAQDIIDEAVMEMSRVEEEGLTLEELYAEQEAGEYIMILFYLSS